MKTQIFRTAITFLCIAIFSVTLNAQNTSPLKVLEFRNIPNGIMDEGKLDKNHLTDYDDNVVCEIIVKAQGFDEATLQRLIFVPRNIMIMQKDYDNGQYRLYVSSKKLGSIVMKYQGDCEWELPYELKPKAIYELTLGMETATLNIISTPDNATIYIDNERVGMGYASKAVSIGAEHHYKVECENYITEENMILFTQSEKKEINVELRPNFGFITVKSTPSDADVYVDDKLVGKTPYLSEIISRGMHKITVNKTGYETAVKRLTINMNEEQTVEFTLVEGESSMAVQQVIVGVSGSSGSNVSSSMDDATVSNISDSSGQLPNTINGHEYVDLGLPSGTLWATCNVGASKPEGCGTYFSWGEVFTKDVYNWNTYKYCNDDYDNLTKYNTKFSYGIVDNKTVLELTDDVANFNWGESWRMPTYDELNELKEKCTWIWTSQNGKNGYKVIGTNGNSIFLPAVGSYRGNGIHHNDFHGYYYSSSLDTDYPNYAYYLSIDSNNVCIDSYYRLYGRSIRPVCSPQK